MELFTIISANVWNIRQKENHRICSVFIIDWPYFNSHEITEKIFKPIFDRSFCQTLISVKLLEYLSRNKSFSFKISYLSFATSNLWKCFNKLEEGMRGGDKDSFSRLQIMSTIYKITFALSKKMEIIKTFK